MNETILVTGGAGYVGSSLVMVLLNEGYRVVVVDNLSFGGESLLGIWNHPEFRFIKENITSLDTIKDVLKTNRIDAVVHLAGIVGDPACAKQPELAKKVNWDASINLLQGCRDSGVGKFIFASTCSNYGKMTDPDGYVNEDSPLTPISLYAELKVKFEDSLLNTKEKMTDFCPTALRFATVHGISPRLRFDLTVNEFTRELVMGRELIVFGEQFWRPYCHVLDISKAILTVLKAETEKVSYNAFNVGDTKENYQKQMIVDEIKKFVPKAKIKYVKKDEDPRDYRVSFEKIKEELGFQITRTVSDGIKEIKYIIENRVVLNPDDTKFRNI